MKKFAVERTKENGWILNNNFMFFSLLLLFIYFSFLCIIENKKSFEKKFFLEIYTQK